MVKSVISIIIVSVMLVIGTIYETNFVNRQFKEFDSLLETLYEKVDDHTAVEDDVLAVQKNWIDKKMHLHVFVSHNEIKEIELWLAEAVTLVRDKKWEDAISKIEVLRELSEQLPKSFSISIENIL